MDKKVVFLDRDGTINVDHGYVSNMDRWEFIPGAPEALRQLGEMGFALAIVTNQSGIAQGRYDAAAVCELHSQVDTILRAQGIMIASWAICPHTHDANCDCRKPRTGLRLIVEHDLRQNIDYGNSWVIGDKISDVTFGDNLGCRTILLRSQYWKEESDSPSCSLVASNLLEGVEHIRRSI